MSSSGLVIGDMGCVTGNPCIYDLIIIWIYSMKPNFLSSQLCCSGCSLMFLMCKLRYALLEGMIILLSCRTMLDGVMVISSLTLRTCWRSLLMLARAWAISLYHALCKCARLHAPSSSSFSTADWTSSSVTAFGTALVSMKSICSPVSRSEFEVYKGCLER